MLVTTRKISEKNPCSAHKRILPVFQDEYPKGVELTDLLTRADKDMPEHIDWICKNFGDDLPQSYDYSALSIVSKAAIVKANPELVDCIGLDAMTKQEKRLINLSIKAKKL